MKVYLVLGYDRHSEVVSKVFSREEDAQKYFDNYVGYYETNEARNYCSVNGRNYAELRVVEVE